MSDTPIQKQASDALKRHEHKLLDVFAQVFKRKKPPASMRALAPFAMVLLLEAFGLAYLLDRTTLRLVLDAAKGVGKSAADDDDLLDDSDDMVAIRWAAERHRQIDVAYRAMARELYNSAPTAHSFSGWLKMGYGPDRVSFEKQWGERNPIDSATAPKCFDPSAQLSILDAVGQGDGYLGAFVSNIMLRSDTTKSITLFGQTLDLAGVETLDEAASRAVMAGWIAYLDHRGAVVGLRLIPRTDGIQTRLRAPLVNIVSMFQEDKRDERIVQLETNIQWHKDTQKELDQRWQDATGASDPEMARELTAQRIEQIKSLTAEREVALDAAKDRVAIAHAVEVCAEDDGDPEDAKNWPPTEHSVGRMIWPDPDNAPTPIACANTIVAHRRGEFVELEFPPTPKIFENIRAWLMFHSFGLRAPTPDATGYCTCAIGPGGEIPPAWNTMKQGKRDSYPGFALFGPGNTGKVVFCAKEPAIKKTAKRSTKKVAP